MDAVQARYICVFFLL